MSIYDKLERAKNFDYPKHTGWTIVLLCRAVLDLHLRLKALEAP